MKPELITVRQAHENLGLPIKTIENHYRLGHIDGIKIENRVYLVNESVEKWAESYRPTLNKVQEGYTAEQALAVIADIISNINK